MQPGSVQKKDLTMSPATALALRPDPMLATVLAFRPTPTSQPLPRLVRRMLELFDGARSVAEVCAEVQIPEAQGLAIVRKLSSQGLLGPRAGAQDRTSLSGFERGETLRDLPRIGFNAVEEAFFASEVQPVEEDEPATLGQRASLFVSDLILRLHGAAL
jgi:hypothetical protein